MDTLVEIKRLSKRFSVKEPLVIDGMDVSIPTGKIIGLVGPDGAGKTTLIRLIAGLLLPSEGSITICNRDTVKDAPYISFLIGYMPQKFGQYEDLTVMQNLELYADLAGLSSDAKREKFKVLLKFTGLEPFTDRLTGALSGGMKQKLGLACSLIRKPTLLLLDEPSVGVDPISRRELWKMIRELLAEGITIVWSTAYLDEAERCDEVILMNEGKVLFYGEPKELTKDVLHRVYKINSHTANQRPLLMDLLQKSGVKDGVIQGKGLRLVVEKNFDVDRLHLDAQETEPRFEDAFIDILQEKPPKPSQLAASRPLIKGNSHPVIKAENLTKRFGSFVAVDHISLSVKNGEIFGLLGPNGAGKSTTFKMLCGLLNPTEGVAFVNGVDLQKAPSEARQHIGYMAQKFSLYGNLSVLQNLEFFAGAYNLRGEAKKKAIEEMVEIFSLSPYLNVSAEQLPLGFKQRLSLASATMHQPEIIFLDEPTSGVDPVTRREFWGHINGLVEKGVTIMITTHFMDEAEYCDQIAMVYQGKIIQMDHPDKLKEMAVTEKNKAPTLEDAFIHLIEEYDAHRSQ